MNRPLGYLGRYPAWSLQLRTHLIVLICIACCAGCNRGSENKLDPSLVHSQDIEPVNAGLNYSGVEKIYGLGEISFPTGQWKLEMRSDPEKSFRNVYIFKRSDGELERLTFELLSPENKLSMDNYWDSICMAISEGIPQQLVGDKNVHDLAHTLVGPFVMQRVGNKITCKGATYVYENDTKPNWMGHAFVCTVDESLVICVHSSTSVLSPTGSQDIFYNSEFVLETDE